MRPLLFAAVFLPLAACVADGSRPSETAGRMTLADGRNLFAVRCSTCHGLPDAKSCSKETMDSMAPAAELKPEERAAIDAYLASVR